ncbi:hypothetical protein L1887_52878 [Cichorium endivia]|nr:hypothetical protein L1887_52878 [Cichorium endivia]
MSRMSSSHSLSKLAKAAADPVSRTASPAENGVLVEPPNAVPFAFAMSHRPRGSSGRPRFSPDPVASPIIPGQPRCRDRPESEVTRKGFCRPDAEGFGTLRARHQGAYDGVLHGRVRLAWLQGSCARRVSVSRQVGSARRSRWQQRWRRHLAQTRHHTTAVCQCASRCTRGQGGTPPRQRRQDQGRPQGRLVPCRPRILVLSSRISPSSSITLFALAFDQLGKVLKDGDAFRGFKEASINFPPTYKYDVLKTLKIKRNKTLTSIRSGVDIPGAGNLAGTTKSTGFDLAGTPIGEVIPEEGAIGPEAPGRLGGDDTDDASFSCIAPG